MNTCRQILQTAFRRSGAIAWGAPMKAAHATVGMELLQDFFDKHINGGLFGELKSIQYDSTEDYIVDEENIYVNNVQDATVTLPIRIVEEGTASEYRPVRDTSIVQYFNNVEQELFTFVYFKNAGWVRIDVLTLGGPCPFTPAYSEDLKNFMALLVAEELGVPITPVLGIRAARARYNLATRLGAERKSPVPDFF